MLALAVISTTINLINLLGENTIANNNNVIFVSLLLVVINWVLVVAERYSYRHGERRKLDMLVDLGVIPSSRQIKATRRKGGHLKDKEIETAEERLQNIMHNNVQRWGD
jgi:hypothetical protein